MVKIKNFVKNKLKILYIGYIKLSDTFVFSKKNISFLKNIHSDKRCFIVATGPSLHIEDLKLIENEITLSMNSIVKLYSISNWRPDYYFISDGKVFKDIGDDITKQNSVKILYGNRDKRLQNIEKANNSIRFNRKHIVNKKIQLYNYYWNLNDNEREKIWKFSNNPNKFVYDGPSVMYIIFQFIAYMGFKKVYLIGTDSKYNTNEMHSKLLDYNSGDPEPYANENLIEMHKNIKRIMDNKGIKVFNASRGGYLEVYPRVNLDDVIRGKENSGF